MIDVAAEFQSRRRATWRKTVWWALLGLVALFTGALLPRGFEGDLSAAQFTTGLVCGVLVGASMVAVTFTVQRLYRCPNCDAIPTGRYSMLFDPVECPACHARLR